MLDIKVNVDKRALDRALSDIQKRQLPYATRRALTATARLATTDVQDAMRRDFDRPTPYTLNSVYAKPAIPSDPTAYVAVRHFSGKGTPADRYLGPQVFGGSRLMKKSERRLGLGYLLPGRGAPLDQYGNVQRGQIVAMLSQLAAFYDTGQNMSERGKRAITRGRKARATYFVGNTKSGNPAIMRVIGRGDVEVMFEIKTSAPTYTPRLPFEAVVRARAGRSFAGELCKALAAAVATAR